MALAFGTALRGGEGLPGAFLVGPEAQGVVQDLLAVLAALLEALTGLAGLGSALGARRRSQGSSGRPAA